MTLALPTSRYTTQALVAGARDELLRALAAPGRLEREQRVAMVIKRLDAIEQRLVEKPP